MNPWLCFALISSAGALGGVINALLTDNRFFTPKYKDGIFCPGFLSNVLIGAVGAFISWSLYGAGASIELAKQTGNIRQDISLTFNALAGAILVGVAGARWLTNETDKQFLKESVREVSSKNVKPDICDDILKQSPMKVFEQIKEFQS